LKLSRFSFEEAKLSSARVIGSGTEIIDSELLETEEKGACSIDGLIFYILF